MKKMMESKFKNKSGFTLVELLIVVAIIGILISISIPLVNTALEKAKDATDDANFRSAAALGTITYLSADDPAATKGDYFYCVNNAKQGELKKDKGGALSGVTAYKSQCTEASSTHGATKTSSNKYIKVNITEGGVVTVTWDATGYKDS